MVVWKEQARQWIDSIANGSGFNDIASSLGLMGNMGIAQAQNFYKLLAGLAVVRLVELGHSANKAIYKISNILRVNKSTMKRYYHIADFLGYKMIRRSFEPICAIPVGILEAIVKVAENLEFDNIRAARSFVRFVIDYKELEYPNMPTSLRVARAIDKYINSMGISASKVPSEAIDTISRNVINSIVVRKNRINMNEYGLTVYRHDLVPADKSCRITANIIRTALKEFNKRVGSTKLLYISSRDDITKEKIIVLKKNTRKDYMNKSLYEIEKAIEDGSVIEIGFYK